ncbi:Stf0 sulfotransferase [Xenococcus sp. PCC 7305]|uniref:hypothetical protein n=1 Tax=Xenococcus sp. PCC 7305 TaxID=102125 RepID=UPI0002ACDC48|nr:hypothetical protein [Xenococcus sp. PCC 7305]ELS03146.1 Stf0 sulfotransferase [Xenococcus sp. PCC 7305]
MSQAIDKFVILSKPSTGSTLLTTTLNNYPEIRCHGEIFRTKITRIQGPVAILNQVDTKFQDDEYKLAYPFELIEEVINCDEGYKCIGFKLMLEQHPSFMAQLIQQNTDYKLILLKRHNALSVYSSREISKATGQTIVGLNGVVKKAKVEFNNTQFETFLSIYEEQYKQVKQLLANSNRKFLEIEYKDLCSGKGFKQVLNFLGCSSKDNPKILTKKRNSNKIIERFTNPEVVSAYLERKNLQKWAIEE